MLLLDKLLDYAQERYLMCVYLSDCPGETLDSYEPGATVQVVRGSGEYQRYRITYVRRTGDVLFVYGVQINEDDSVVDRGWYRFTTWLVLFAVAYFGYQWGIR